MSSATGSSIKTRAIEVWPTDTRAVGAQATDGRTARRERNVDLVLDVVVELFSEGDLFPAVELVSNRSGVSVRSIYRYFTDPATLHAAAVERHRRRSESLAHLSDIGRGPLERRIEDFVAMRLRLHRGIGAAYRATVHGALNGSNSNGKNSNGSNSNGKNSNGSNSNGSNSNTAVISNLLSRGRRDLRAQFEQQFKPELSALTGPDRDAVCNAGDTLTQLDSIELLRQRRLTVIETERTLRFGLQAILNHHPSERHT